MNRAAIRYARALSLGIVTRVLCVVVASAAWLVASATLVADETTLKWTQLPELPDAHGFGGPLVGTHAGVLIVAGGANFPDGPPWPVDGRPAGAKVWHDKIFALEPGAEAWRFAGQLPHSLAYAAVVSAADGIYVLGGETFGARRDKTTHESKPTNFDTAGVLRLRWNPDSKRVVVDKRALPDLPRACSYHAAVCIGQRIYVAAGHAGPKSRRLDEKGFWRLDLGQPEVRRHWQTLPGWPGAARHKMALASVPTTQTDQPGEKVFLISGSTWAKDSNGEMKLGDFKYYDDAAYYDSTANRWTEIASLPRLAERREIDTRGYLYNGKRGEWLPAPDNDVGEQERPGHQRVYRTLFNSWPRPAAASTAIAADPSRILLFSGSTGRYVTMAVPDRPAFPSEVLLYDVPSNRWQVAGHMPEAVVTTGATLWNDRVVVPSGEVRPGVRTRRVQAVQVVPGR